MSSPIMHHAARLSSWSPLVVLLATLLVAVLPVTTLAQDAEPAAAAPPTNESAALERINQRRAASGLHPLVVHPALTESTAGHGRYYDANRDSGTLVGMGLHEQDAAAPGFTGASIADRAKAAGYDGGTVTENVGFGRLDVAVDWYLDTVNHRLPLLHPSAFDIGITQSASGFGVIAVGLRSDPLGIELPSVYPSNGTTDVPTTWDGVETPDPAPGVARPLGYPITVAFARYQRVDWVTTELRGAGGTLLDVSSPRTDWMRATAIIPHQPLVPGGTYTVRVEAVVDGAPVTKTWSFSTRP